MGINSYSIYSEFKNIERKINMQELKRKAMIYLQGMIDGLNVVEHCNADMLEEASTQLKITIDALKDLDIITDKDLETLNEENQNRLEEFI